MLKNSLYIRQLDSQDCGLACLKAISKYYGKNIPMDNDVFKKANLYKQGLLLSDLDKIANQLGFGTLCLKSDFEHIANRIPLPAVFFWNQRHYIIVYKIKNNKVYVSDPAIGLIVYSKAEFLKGWMNNNNEGILLLLEPQKKFYELEYSKKESSKNIKYIINHLKKFRPHLLLIGLTLFISSLIELIFPFFTQKIIDKGVFAGDISMIYWILAAQLTLFISRISLEFYRSWVFIHISSRINLSIISEFLEKLMKLPIKFFNGKNIGDLMQRIHDHKRIEEFLSKDLLQTVFSIFTLIIYLGVLLFFDTKIFLIVVLSTVLELLWIFRFLEKIRILDQKTFSLDTKDQDKIYELITGMQEIKINNLEKMKTSQWQEIQSSIYLNNISKLKINQQYESYQFIDYLRSIIVIFFSAIAVTNQNITIGTMLAIMFVLGGMNAPISKLINFVLRYQLVVSSFKRLNQIHNKSEEKNHRKIKRLKKLEDIYIEDLNFSYDTSNLVLENINLKIPKGKVTAIVGVSGSGKTSLLKLILKFYDPNNGRIILGNNDLKDIDNKEWRNRCGVILQDSFIFSETIGYNIALEVRIDQKKFTRAIELANIEEFLNKFPLGINTILGKDGIGISEGQKQRILIARMIYKNPDYLFFDEATNSLDAKNERLIVENLNDHFKKKTMIVVAHRLSTVKNADQIIVMDGGKIIEKGNHYDLIELRGKYFELIKNQLELGN